MLTPNEENFLNSVKKTLAEFDKSPHAVYQATWYLTGITHGLAYSHQHATVHTLVEAIEALREDTWSTLLKEQNS